MLPSALHKALRLQQHKNLNAHFPKWEDNDKLLRFVMTEEDEHLPKMATNQTNTNKQRQTQEANAQKTGSIPGCKQARSQPLARLVLLALTLVLATFVVASIGIESGMLTATWQRLTPRFLHRAAAVATTGCAPQQTRPTMASLRCAIATTWNGLSLPEHKHTSLHITPGEHSFRFVCERVKE